MRFFLLYLATISTAITRRFLDLSLPASSLDSAASKDSNADVPEIEHYGTTVPSSNSALDSLDTDLLSLDHSGSVTADIHPLDPGTGKARQGDLATAKYLSPLLWFWTPTCETLFPGKKPYCCDDKLDEQEHTAAGCDHCRPLSIFLCTCLTYVSRAQASHGSERRGMR